MIFKWKLGDLLCLIDQIYIVHQKILNIKKIGFTSSTKNMRN